MNYERMEQALDMLQRRWQGLKIDDCIIFGSGWSAIADIFDTSDRIPYDDIPGLGPTSIAGHSGHALLGSCCGRQVLIFQGRRHWYEGEGWTPVALPVYLARQLGVRQLILTNAAGGIRSGFQPGDFMLIQDHINQMGVHPLIGPHTQCWGPRFPDHSQVYDPDLCTHFMTASDKAGIPLRKGIYLATSGPCYETPAEIKAFHSMGADAVGMSTVPEASLGHAAGIRIAAISCITNLAAGISEHALSHDEVTETTRLGGERMKQLMRAFWAELADA